ncbi:keratin, type I cytoskeletal 19-like [Tiliqua scincoides]|uniref:keratin, type I cytoskeletal 19-like n=1 Tax=Tiliqua scincoides TaxID=71010 RepID=UPI003462315E
MGGVIGGVPAGVVGGMGGVVPGPAVVGGLGGDPILYGGMFSNLDGKMTMQNLNERLASYLDKVRWLEEENAELEGRIREFYAKQGPLCEPKDYSHYHQQIEDLKNQLICTSVENNKLLLCIDNSKLTADDFRTKFETECCLRQNVEADINGLHQILDQLTACRADLEVQCENLQDELCGLKKNHEEEITCLKNQSTGDVNVEVNACPGPDLRKILEEMRCKYETMIEGNRKEVEAWYGSKIEEVNRDVCTSSQEIEESNNKVTELRRQLQALEIDYDAQCSLRDTLEGSLGETEHRYNNHLGELQGRISCLEQQLAELRSEMECQNHEYTELLDVKSRLEQEIATYRCLLEGGQHDIVMVVTLNQCLETFGRRANMEAEQRQRQRQRLLLELAVHLPGEPVKLLQKNASSSDYLHAKVVDEEGGALEASRRTEMGVLLFIFCLRQLLQFA